MNGLNLPGDRISQPENSEYKMALANNNSGNGIMASRAASAMLDDIHKRLALRMAALESEDQLALLHKVSAELLQEERIDTWMADEIAALRERLASVHDAGELKPLCDKLATLTDKYFKARASVITVHELTTAFLEALLSSALALASGLLALEGHYPADISCAILAADALGRRESTQRGHNTIILIHAANEQTNSEYFHLLALRVMAILTECAIPVHRNHHKGGNWFWFGSLPEWYGLLDGTFAAAGQPATPLEELFPRLVEAVADLRPIAGDINLANSIAAGSKQRLVAALGGDRFHQYARRVVTLPVALGIFGRFKTARTGKHRGEFSLEELATNPLIASARVMALVNGITATATVDRIKALLANGNLGVALAERLLVAFHDFVRCQIEMELNAQTNGTTYFFNPSALEESARERFKSGLEDLTTLQRLAYQQIVEVE